MAYPERSVVTVMVVDAVSSTSRIATVDPDDAQLMVDKVLDHIRTEVERAGGLLVSFAGDGGVAVFGWPDSMEDHADRACDAAWNIQHYGDRGEPIRDPVSNVVQFRVGIHSGLVGLRNLTLERSSQIDLVGGTVHLAARLEKTAEPGEILLSGKTLELCRYDQKCGPRPDLQILDEIGSSVFTLTALADRTAGRDVIQQYKLPIVGRDRELSMLRDTIKVGMAKNGALAIIGEPGIGKSRLAAAAIHEALSNDIADRLVVFRGDMQKRITPFAVMQGLILDALNLDDQASRQEIWLAAEAVGVKPDALSALDAIVSSESRSPSGSTPHLSLKETATALVRTFRNLAIRGRTVLLVEDLHIVDPESQLCLEMLQDINDSRTLFLLVTGRPEAAYDAQQITDAVMRLEPMDRAHMRQMAHQLIAGSAPEHLSVEKALDQADGIPFVLEQFFCSIDSDDPESIHSVPHGVQSMIHARLNRLPRSAKHCAQALSILGEEVDLDFAQKVLGKDGGQLDAEIDTLEKLAIASRMSRRTVRFRHAIIAEACSITVPRARRTEIHRSAIDIITQTYPDLAGQYERLVFHAESAGDDELALDYLSRAADMARRNFAGKSLQLLFEHALECIERIGEPAEKKFVDLTLMVCPTMLQLGEFSKMHDYLPRAMALAMKQNRINKICAAKCNIAMIDWFEGRYKQGAATVTEALEMAREMDSLPHTFAAQHLLAVLNHATGDLAKAIELERSLCEQLTGDVETARLGSAGIPGAISRAFLGWFLTDTGAYEESLEYGRRALDISRSSKDPYTEVVALNALGRTLIMMERYKEAVETLNAAIALIERHGYDAPKPHIIGLLAMAMARNGQADEALEMAQDCFNNALHLRTGRLEIFYLYAGYAEALFHSGAVERCIPAIDQAIAIGRGINNPGLTAQGLAIRAKLTAQINPSSPLLSKDIDEHRALCETHGFKALA
ncbi:ATP-binding protein [Hoeflea prorocentri]|uniref:Tetratricopeptide repeat protein n=1 Tax=Hoeflea prorocentri TaxID=1922333 RepID=A0A9X3ZJA6_9HYPH|nr:tetratricopeptide repeat protein [Hoeflea prorocentri]MCY6383249.1 tetratricopeptide repeat protein [Hoeflea prorocentri]MDA5401049.1 tetratricopeptide repeat protein [Hoeflea prorocentri]